MCYNCKKIGFFNEKSNKRRAKMNITNFIHRICVVFLVCISVFFILMFIIKGTFQEFVTLMVLSTLVGGAAFLIDRTFSWIIAGLRVPKIDHKEQQGK